VYREFTVTAQRDSGGPLDIFYSLTGLPQDKRNNMVDAELSLPVFNQQTGETTVTFSWAPPLDSVGEYYPVVFVSRDPASGRSECKAIAINVRDLDGDSDTTARLIAPAGGQHPDCPEISALGGIPVKARAWSEWSDIVALEVYVYDYGRFYANQDRVRNNLPGPRIKEWNKLQATYNSATHLWECTVASEYVTPGYNAIIVVRSVDSYGKKSAIGGQNGEGKDCAAFISVTP